MIDNLQDYIGYPIDFVKDLFDKNNIKYEVIMANSTKENYDTFLVVNIIQKKDIVTIITDKFLINI